MKTRMALAAMVISLFVATAAFAQSVCYNCFINAYNCWNCQISIGGGTGCSSSCMSCTLTGHCADGGPGCFTGSMNIATPDGNVRIDSLKKGDRVLIKGDGSSTHTSEVIEIQAVEAWSYLVINDNIMVTDEHPFWVDGNWVKAASLEIGDYLTTVDGAAKEVVSIARVDRGVRVYNLSVGGDHTYYCEGVLVHNKPPIPTNP